MGKQRIIAISREYGSGGHQVAREVAAALELPLYDKNLLEEIARQKSVDVKQLEKYDEHPKHHLLSRRVKGYSNSPQEVIAQMQFDYLRNLAGEGKSFVVLGRCGEYVLKDYEGLVSIFILADETDKTASVAQRENVSLKEADVLRKRTDLKRKMYHNNHCPQKWGDARNYDLTINSSRLGLERTTKLILQYLDDLQEYRCGQLR